MSKEIKMSDVFELPVRNETGVYVESDNFRYLEAVDDAEIASKILVLDYTSHAINNHDRLVEENKRLREALAELVETSDMNEAQLSQELLEFHQESTALVNAKQLLSELGGE